MEKKRNGYEPLLTSSSRGVFNTPATYPERSFCRPGAPGPIGPFLSPKRGSLSLLSSLPYNSTPHKPKSSFARALQGADGDLPHWRHSTLSGGSHLGPHTALAPPSPAIAPPPGFRCTEALTSSRPTPPRRFRFACRNPGTPEGLRTRLVVARDASKLSFKKVHPFLGRPSTVRKMKVRTLEPRAFFCASQQFCAEAALITPFIQGRKSEAQRVKWPAGRHIAEEMAERG